MTANYYNNQTTFMDQTNPGEFTTKFSGGVTFSEVDSPSNTFQINFNNLTSSLPYLPGKTYNLTITEVPSTPE
jgi:hypothetical protein